MARRSTSWRRGILGLLQIAAVVAAGVAGSTFEAAASGRLALVLTAEEYQALPRSPIGVKRGADIADSLKALGFDVIVGANPTNSTARASVADFSRKAQDADLALVVLAGHTTSANGQSFFLPVNVEIGAATDLLSRGISITNLAHLVGGAKAGAVLVLMSVPTFTRPVDGIDARPAFTAMTGKTPVVAFSSSTKVPVSRVDALSGQNAESLAKVFRKPGATLSDAVAAVTSEGGLVVGAIPDLRLDVVPPPPVVQATNSAGDAAQRAAALAAEQKAVAMAAEQKAAATAAEQKLREEQSAREKAEARAAEEKRRSSGIETELALAQQQARAARLEAEKAKAEAEKMLAEAEKAKAQAEADKARIQIQAERDKAKLALEQAEAEKKIASLQRANVPSAPIDEKELGQKQRLGIQERLKAMSLYTGPLDAIMGPLTREAIMGFQKSRGEAVTGYLTPEQFQALVPGL